MKDIFGEFSMFIFVKKKKEKKAYMINIKENTGKYMLRKKISKEENQDIKKRRAGKNKNIKLRGTL